MKIIEKIEIHRFRSMSDAYIEAEDLNIFSGINNSGKSNILRALNLFFNNESKKYDFYKDYNHAFTGQAGGKRATRIILHFGAQGDAALSEPFSIMRVFQFGREVETSYHSTNENIQKKLEKGDGNVNRQFTTFLNKIKFYYIPAVRDKIFVQRLFLDFEKLIEHDSGKDFAEKMHQLSDILKVKSEDISSDFEKFIGLPTRAALSSKASDLLGTVEINVKTGIEIIRRTKAEGKKRENIEVNLFSSGDGILMAYLAYFLAHICKKISNKIFIWGFEEPENSLEYSKVQTIADEFHSEFLNNAQIFVTTHSPAFINLKDKQGVCFYRVYIEPNDVRQASKIKTIKEIEDRQLSLFKSGETDSSEYEKLSKELNFVEFAKEIEAAVEKVQSREKEILSAKKKIEKKLKNIQRPVIFVEGETDEKYWKKCIEILFNKKYFADIQWVGNKDKNGQAMFGGDGSLDKLKTIIRANPGLSEKMVVLLYDVDKKKETKKESEKLAIFCPEKNKDAKYKTGIEHLLILPYSFNKNKFIRTNFSGDKSIIETDKQKLCDYICENISGVKQKKMLINLYVVLEKVEKLCKDKQKN